jgi:hypothetical protein
LEARSLLDVNSLAPMPAPWVQVFHGDFNGDSNGTNDFTTGNAWARWSIASSWNHLFVGDFNGDGKADVAGFGNNGAWFVGLGNGMDTFNTGKAWAHWSTSASWFQLFVGDFNGDGKADIGGVGFNTSTFVGVSDGIGSFVTGPSWYNWEGRRGTATDFNQFYLADVNGDCKTDLVTFQHAISSDGGADVGHWTAVFSNGDSFGNTRVTEQWNQPNNWAQLLIADFTGDGRADLAGFANPTVSQTPGLTVSTAGWYVGPTFDLNGNTNLLGSQTEWVHW